MTAVILSAISPSFNKATAALEMATEMLNHRDRVSAVVSALVTALKNSGDTDGMLPLAQVAEDLALDTAQDVRLVECLKALQ